MGNQLADEVKKAEANKPPSDAELREELARERGARQQAENQATQTLAAAQTEWARAEAANARLRAIQHAAPPREDPFAKFTEEGIANDPEKQREMLDRGARQRAREEIGPAFQEAERRRLAGEWELQQKIALEMFQISHPTVVADDEGFAAAMMKAQIRAKKSQQTLSPAQMLNLGLEVYNEGKATAGTVPYTEGAGMPGGRVGSGSQSDEPPAPTLWETLYGAQPGEVHSDGDPSYTIDDLTEEYVDARNNALRKLGVSSTVRQVRATLLDGQRREKNRQGAGR